MIRVPVRRTRYLWDQMQPLYRVATAYNAACKSGDIDAIHDVLGYLAMLVKQWDITPRNRWLWAPWKCYVEMHRRVTVLQEAIQRDMNQKEVAA